MPTPHLPRRLTAKAQTGTTNTKLTISDAEWRCTRCNKLLGKCRNGRMHLRFTRGHEYFVSFPVTATCRGCGTLNQNNGPAH